MSPNVARIVGLDLGTRRIGVAVSDGLGLTAQPWGTIDRKGGVRDLDAVARVVGEVQAGLVVLGLPLNLDEGDDGEGRAARSARAFAERLRGALTVPVELIDESFSTVEAEERLIEADLSRARRRQVIDRLAAAVILQRWLDAHRDVPQTQPGDTEPR